MFAYQPNSILSGPSVRHSWRLNVANQASRRRKHGAVVARQCVVLANGMPFTLVVPKYCENVLCTMWLMMCRGNNIALSIADEKGDQWRDPGLRCIDDL